MQEFIVAYNSRECNIRQKADDEQFCHDEMTKMYDWELSHHNCVYGDIIGWNNQFWGVVEAENSYEALIIFMEKMKKERQ